MSAKTGRIVEAESPVERDLFRTWEFDPNVVDYVQQPLKIPYVGADGKTHTYTPDGRARFRRRPKGAGPNGILVEVKTRRYLARNWLKIRPAMRAAIAWARGNGITFHIYNEKKIRTQYFKNASFLLPYRQVDCRGPEARQLLRILARGKAALGDLLNEACKAGFVREDVGPALYALIATFRAVVDLEKPLTKATVVGCRKGGRL
jgi:TnsA endonuclease N terminal